MGVPGHPVLSEDLNLESCEGETDGRPYLRPTRPSSTVTPTSRYPITPPVRTHGVPSRGTLDTGEPRRIKSGVRKGPLQVQSSTGFLGAPGPTVGQGGLRPEEPVTPLTEFPQTTTDDPGPPTEGDEGRDTEVDLPGTSEGGDGRATVPEVVDEARDEGLRLGPPDPIHDGPTCLICRPGLPRLPLSEPLSLLPKGLDLPTGRPPLHLLLHGHSGSPQYGKGEHGSGRAGLPVAVTLTVVDAGDVVGTIPLGVERPRHSPPTPSSPLRSRGRCV